MINVRLAGFNFCINNKYKYLEKQCKDYLSDSPADMTISLSEEDILKEQDGGELDMGYLESLAVYRRIAEFLPYHNAFLMHGTVIDAEGSGIAFLAKSGVGKTTHMANWKKLLGERLTVVNGDKPIIRILDEGIYAYGTPWAGKERLHTNMRAPLKSICFIERSEENYCERLDGDVLRRLAVQIYRPADSNAYLKTFEMMGHIIKNANFYLIRCNMDISSAKTAYDTIMNRSSVT